MSTVISQTTVRGPVDVTIKVLTDSEPSAGLTVLGAVLDQAMLVAAERVLVPELKKTVSVEGPPPSEPFTPPHTQPPTDQSSQASPSDQPPLIDSIGAWMHPDGGIAVGSVNKYGLYLEIGTQDMAARPWLVPTLNRTDVINAFNREVRTELERLLDQIAGDSAPAQPQGSGAVAA